MAARTDETSAPPRRSARRWALAGLALAAVAAVSAALLLTGDPLGGGHQGDQVAEPSASAADDGLVAATTQVHAHLNWLLWGPDDAALDPGWTEVVDETIGRAEQEGRDELVRVLRATRDLALQQQAWREAHELASDAETLARGGEIERDELYLAEVEEADAPAGAEGE